jgi:hypothetical protein
VTSVDVIQALLGALGLGSVIVGGYVAFVKLRPDMNSAAVEQAMEAMKGMKMLKDDVERERDAWRTRALDAEQRLQGATRDP